MKTTLKKLKVPPEQVITRLEKVCEGCPAAWEGRTQSGAQIYIRYRWGHFRVDINGEIVMSESRGDGHDGTMTTEEMQLILKDYFLFNCEVVEHHYDAF